MAGRETAFRFGLDGDMSLSLARTPCEPPACLSREGVREFDGGTDFTSFRLPGRTASARLASIAWGRELSMTGRILGCSPLRATRPIRSRSPDAIWRRAMSWDWSWSRRMTDRARLWAEKSRP
ncbi:MAG: hypothetical protein NT147_03810 [Candidatus Aminicenantes bacterium]|nr:hypothetical protein [Candidatus Aminicenantes bacterium]